MINTDVENELATPTSDLSNDDFTLEVVEDDNSSEDDSVIEVTDLDNACVSDDKTAENAANIPDSTSTLPQTEITDKTSTVDENNSTLRHAIIVSPDESETEPQTNSRPKRKKRLGKSTHPCPLCFFEAPNISDLYIHQLYCTPRKHRILTCMYCTVSVRGAKLLEEHILKEHAGKKMLSETESRNVKTDSSIFQKCGICGFKSLNPQKADKHRASHDKWTMYLCDLCDFRDLSLVLLQRHRDEHRKKRNCAQSVR